MAKEDLENRAEVLKAQIEFYRNNPPLASLPVRTQSYLLSGGMIRVATKQGICLSIFADYTGNLRKHRKKQGIWTRQGKVDSF